MFYVYILKSKKTKKHYIGCTNNIHNRVNQHNSGQTDSTKYGIPWKLIAYREFMNQSDAFAHEKLVKSYKGGNAFKNILNGEVAEWSKAAPC